MLFNFICIIFSVAAGAAGCYLYLKPKLLLITEKNNEILVFNKELENKNKKLLQENNKLQIKKDNLLNNLEELNKQSQQSAQIFYEQNMELARANLKQDLKNIEQKYENAKLEYQSTYLALLNENTEQYLREIESKSLEIEELNELLKDLHSIADAAIRANKRQYEIEQSKDFYRLVIDEKDLEEIKMIKQISFKIKNPELLNKLIWKMYYEKPYTDLIGRVIGSGTHTGIYKITNLNTQMCYVGQAVNIADRWKQHIKRGLGAETPTKNKLYPAMEKFGIENFSFEVVEECSRSLLNEREDYWQEYFKAKEFGYSIK